MTKIAGVLAGEYVVVYSLLEGNEVQTVDLMVMPDSVGITLSRDQAQALVNAIQGLLHGPSELPTMSRTATGSKRDRLTAGAEKL